MSEAIDDKTGLVDDLIFDRAYDVEQRLITALGLFDDLAGQRDAARAPVWKYRSHFETALAEIRAIVNAD